MDKMLTVFGCEQGEQRLFEQYKYRLGMEIHCVEAPLGVRNARSIPLESAISVNHKSPIDARSIRMLQGRGVHYLSSRSIGLDHIDREAAKAAGIHVENVTYSPESVAEHTIMLMLMALRNAGAILRRVNNHDFRLEEKHGRELRDMTVGVVGTGRIGKAVIALLEGFGCTVLAYDPHPSAKATYVGLDVLARESDIVTLHMPLTSDTWHLWDHARMAKMRERAILINTARGALVDVAALTDALAHGDMAFAAMDVVEGEDGFFYQDCSALAPPPFARLLALPNAIVTPHTAFYTDHALCDIVKNTVQGFLHYTGGAKRWVG